MLIVGISLVNISCSPSLTRSQKKWKIYHRDINSDNIECQLEVLEDIDFSKPVSEIDDLEYPLEVIEDGYKLIVLYKTKKPIEYSVEWGWKLLLRNLSRRDIDFWLEYKLIDKDDFVLTRYSHRFSKTIKAGETSKLQETSRMGYEEAKRVKGRVWKISGHYTIP